MRNCLGLLIQYSLLVRLGWFKKRLDVLQNSKKVIDPLGELEKYSR